MFMLHYFDSPTTIRNKAKEFKTVAFNGLSKHDVDSYLSSMSEQVSVLQQLLKDKGISINVDDDAAMDDVFSKPTSDEDKFLTPYMAANSQELSELKAKVARLEQENDLLRQKQVESSQAVSEAKTESLSIEFDTSNGLETSNVDSDITIHLEKISEQAAYIENLEAEVQELMSKSNSQEVTSLERAAYESEITSLRADLEEVRSKTDVFSEVKLSTVDESEMTALKQQISELENNLSLKNAELVSSSECAEKELLELNVKIKDGESIIDSLRRDIEAKETTIFEYKAKIESLEADNISANSMLSEEASKVARDLDETRAKISLLENEIEAIKEAKADVEGELFEVKSELSKYKTYTTPSGKIVTIDLQSLMDAREQNLALETENKKVIEELENKLKLISEKEEIIENNKELLSDNFVEDIKRKENEINTLRKQMDKMLVVAEETANRTTAEADDVAKNLLADAQLKADEIVAKAEQNKELLVQEANSIIESANELKNSTETELEEFRKEIRVQAEETIRSAEMAAEAKILEAKETAESICMQAQSDVDDLMAKANVEVGNIEKIILEKQESIDSMKLEYEKVKREIYSDFKAVNDRLENILYGELMN